MPTTPPPVTSSSSKSYGLPSRQQRMEVVIPMAKPPSMASRSQSLRADSSDLPPPSPYSYAGTAPSFQSTTASFTSLVPEDPGYNLELERLRIEFRRSQENLHAEREFNAAQTVLHAREIASQEARHRAEIDALRQKYGESSKGKGRGG